MNRRDRNKLTLIALICYIESNGLKEGDLMICTPSEDIVLAQIHHIDDRFIIQLLFSDFKAYKMNGNYLIYPDNEVLLDKMKGSIHELWIRSFGMMQSMVRNEAVDLYTSLDSYSYLIKLMK